MSRAKQKRVIHKVFLTAGLMAASQWVLADETANATRARTGANPNDMAALSAVLSAASARKQLGIEVVLLNDAYLHDRPTGDVDTHNKLRAGTIVRQSKKPLTNATGTWRHVETSSGNDGWMHEADLGH
jgi:hypothetical protein